MFFSQLMLATVLGFASGDHDRFGSPRFGSDSGGGDTRRRAWRRSPIRRCTIRGSSLRRCGPTTSSRGSASEQKCDYKATDQIGGCESITGKEWPPGQVEPEFTVLCRDAIR